MDQELFSQYHRQMLVIDALLEKYAPERVWAGFDDEDAVICTIHRPEKQITITVRGLRFFLTRSDEVMASEYGNIHETILNLGIALEATK